MLVYRYEYYDNYVLSSLTCYRNIIRKNVYLTYSYAYLILNNHIIKLLNAQRILITAVNNMKITLTKTIRNKSENAKQESITK